MFRTQTGEITIHARELTVLGKSLRPLPIVKVKDGVVYDSFDDPELRYRRRYVDLVVNEGVKETFIKRTKVFNSMREYFNTAGYLEVETPILQSIPGGAAARPFITHHNALDIPLYLRIADELYLKRLIVAVSKACTSFPRTSATRAWTAPTTPSSPAWKYMWPTRTNNWMMKFTERMLEKICLDVNGTTKVMVGDNEIDFKAPYRRVTMTEAILEHTGIDITGMDEEALRGVCRDLGIETAPSMGKGKLIDEIFGEKCEGKYIQPTFITDYPIEMSRLQSVTATIPSLPSVSSSWSTARNSPTAYSELNDPIDQYERFVEQMRLGEKGDDEAMIIDKDFIRALEYGMPPTSGMGIGMDRLVMLMTGKTPYKRCSSSRRCVPKSGIKNYHRIKPNKIGLIRVKSI